MKMQPECRVAHVFRVSLNVEFDDDMTLIFTFNPMLGEGKVKTAFPILSKVWLSCPVFHVCHVPLSQGSKNVICFYALNLDLGPWVIPFGLSRYSPLDPPPQQPMYVITGC